MNTTSPRLTELDPGDFVRLGVQPQECRLTVIRHAAARTALMVAQANARRTANQSAGVTNTSHGFSDELAKVAASAYRLLDPRRRVDATERAHVGRILPGALIAAGHTKFHATPFTSNLLDTTEDDITAPVLIGDTAITETVPHHEPWSMVLNKDAAELREQICTQELIRHYESMLPLERIRRWVHQPQMIVSLIGALLFTSVWLVYWRLQETARVPIPTLTQQSPISASALATPSLAMSSGEPSSKLIENNKEILESYPPTSTLPSMDAPEIPASHAVPAPRIIHDWTLLIANKLLPKPVVNSIAELPEKPVTTRVPGFSAAESSETRIRLISELITVDYLETESDIAKLQAAADQFLEANPNQSVERWSGEIIGATPAWFTGDIGEMHRRWRRLSGTYDVQFNAFLAMTYVEANALPCTSLLRKRIASHGLAATPLILSNDMLDIGEELVRLSRTHGEDVQQWEYLTEAIKLARRSISRVTERGTFDEANPSEATIIGRHLCFLSQDWSEGLPWLARCSDARLSAIASNELALTEPNSKSATVLAEVSKSWQGFSKGLSGYSQQVVQLHALELLSQAVSLASPIEELRLAEEVELIRSQIPKSLLSSNQWAKQIELLNRDESATPLASATEPINTPQETQSEYDQPIYLNGEIRTADGGDAMLSLRYESGKIISPANLVTLYRHSRWPFASISFDISGRFSAFEDRTLVVHTQPSSRKTLQAVYIDDESIQIDPLEGVAQCRIGKGEHRIRWVVDGVSNDPLFLSLDFNDAF